MIKILVRIKDDYTAWNQTTVVGQNRRLINVEIVNVYRLIKHF